MKWEGDTGWIEFEFCLVKVRVWGRGYVKWESGTARWMDCSHTITPDYPPALILSITIKPFVVIEPHPSIRVLEKQGLIRNFVEYYYYIFNNYMYEKLHIIHFLDIGSVEE